MQAALPMYYPPREALQAFWAALAGLLRADGACAGLDIPLELSEPLDCHAQWQERDLLLSQACGYPLVTLLKDRVRLVGTFAYDAPGTRGVTCRSQLLCRAGDARQSLAQFAGSTLALNDRISQSGYNALRALLAAPGTARPFFAATVQTGAHIQSMEAVRTGRADLAAVDAVTWALWQRSHPEEASALRVFGQTAPYPGLPLITSLQTPTNVVTALRRGLQALASEPAYAALRAPLLICGFEATTLADYQICLDMQEQACASGLQSL